MQIYLHNPPGQRDSFWTRAVPHKITGKPVKGDTLSGYGSAMPTNFAVLFNGRWRRVKCARFGNAPSYFIGRRGAWLAVVQFVEQGAKA